jgi:ABC-2 type transport system ATP-binding protein
MQAFALARTFTAQRDRNVFVETDHLTKRYGDVTALHQCSLEVRRGEVFGLLGPNGAGKTTLLRMLLGFLHPTSGEARIDGFDCCRQSLEVRQRVSYLPGEVRLFRHMRGRDVLHFFAHVRSTGNLDRATKLAQQLDLDLSRRVSFMSTGMRQKLALAATLSADTPLIILDEPTSNLDPTVRGTVMGMVAKARRQGRTVMFSSHVLSEVEETCDRVMILRAGRLVHTQVMSELRRRHRIHATMRGSIPPVPPDLDQQLSISESDDGHVMIETPGELSPLLGWLSTLDLHEVRIEPVGLRAVYDQFHSELS